ncbi:MAG: UDP-N-acetylmuramoyl-L-alanine--D-glutamate ligase [Gammaproteobacteria bacterium]|nr:UDP-N-acetylmuramoyl-L-alanine--D-glutamate ligase [Gammaproteobacteria bacterium]
MVAPVMTMDANAANDPTVLIMGLGETGASCARYFASRGIVAEFFDSREAPPGVAGVLDIMPDAVIHRGVTEPRLSACIECVVVSPGVDMNAPLLEQARSKGIRIVSDIDLFVSECLAPIVAITGSNGKSTVTTMAGELLEAAGLKVAVGGNLGVPALDLLDIDADVYALELSSFQLERSAVIPAAVSVLLNISPDHLDKHGDMAAYAAAKHKIYAGCQHAVINRDVPELAALVPGTLPRTTFGLDEPAAGHIGIRRTARGECIACGDELLLSVDEMPLLGRHNLSNALAVLAIGAALGANLGGMAQALKRFRGLPHRMELVAEADDVRWIDDSKATNVGAACMSLAGIEDPFVLIAGGDAKGATFEQLADALKGRDGHVVLMGHDAQRMALELQPVIDVQVVDGMAAAVSIASGYADPGYTVLLAPACASQDMFRDYAARGRAFRAAIEALAK